MSGGLVYFDCFSGASGDMLLGSLLDAGLELSELREALDALGLSGYRLSLTHQVRQGIGGSKFSVIDEGHARPARNLTLVRELLESSELTPKVMSSSLQVFQRLAQAEAQVHGTTVDQVHFHEVGAVDTLVDIVGFCWAMERLKIDAVHASALPLGRGSIRTEHGLLPVPAPATLALLAAVGAPTVPSEGRGEMVTPTGAALLTTLATFTRPAMVVRRVGYGFGSREFPWPNVVRVWIGEEHQPSPAPSLDAVGEHRHPSAHAHSHGAGHGHEPPARHEPSAKDEPAHQAGGSADAG